jgi:cyclase
MDFVVDKHKSIRIIPRIDVKGENVVKGVHLEGLRVVGCPSIFSSIYYQEFADEIIFMDTVASLYGRNNLHEIVANAASKIFIPMTVGGGVRSIEDVRMLLEHGADKVAINTALFSNPDLIKNVADNFGSSCMVVSIDVIKSDAGDYECLTENGRENTGVELFEWLEKVIHYGAGEILLTSVDNEGTGLGFDIKLVEKVSNFCPIPVIACGGAGKKEHVLDVINKTDTDAVALSSILHYDLANRGLDVESKEGNKGFLKNIKGNNIKEIRKGISSTTVIKLKNYLSENSINLRIK